MKFYPGFCRGFSLLVSVFLSVVTSFSAHAESDGSIQKDLDELSTRVLKNKVIWSGDYTSFVDSFEDTNREKNTHDSTWGRLRHRLRLGLRAEPSQYVRFTGRLAAYKNFPAMDSQESYVYPDRNYYSLRPYNDSALRIDRMYVDFFPSWKWISGAFGLFPTTEGLPSDLHRLQPRKSTYPNLLFNTGFAGVVAALHPQEIFQVLPETHIWFIYSASYEAANRNTGYTIEDATRFSTKNAANIYVVNVEVKPKVSWSDELLVSAGYATVQDYKIGDDPMTLAVLRGLTNLTLNPEMNIGRIDRFSVHVQASHLFGTGLNFFTSAALTPMTNEPVYTTLSALPSGQPTAQFGLTGSVHRENRWGKAIHMGVSYDALNKLSSVFGAPTFGYEYFISSRQFFGLYTAGEDITSRTENPGVSHKFFYTQPITSALKLHLSYINYIQRSASTVYEIFIPGLADSNSFSRAGRTLHAVQFSGLFSF